MILNKNNMPAYVTNTKYSDSTLKSMTKDELVELLGIAQHNYEVAQSRIFNVTKYAEKLDKALDKASEILDEGYGYGNASFEYYYDFEKKEKIPTLLGTEGWKNIL